MQALFEAGFFIPAQTPKKWVVDCRRVGKGISAVKYLSKYLYRGVLSENNIVSNQNGQVTFRYKDNTGTVKYRTVKGEYFLYLLMLHVLPKGFRRVRDYGFLHSNSKKLLGLVQLVLHVRIMEAALRPRPFFKCPHCKFPMLALGVRFGHLEPG